jgi:zinc transport system substrate-binding protein
MKRVLLWSFLVLTGLVCMLSTGCKKSEEKSAGKLMVITTLFPLYDFARIIGGDNASVSLLLPPGVEPHTFEPKPDDMIRISRAGLFIYTSSHMEPWAERIVSGVGTTRLKVVQAGQHVIHHKAHEEAGHDHDHGHGKTDLDPHFWLDFALAATAVDTILDGFSAADPVHSVQYRHNAEELKKQLAALDVRYRTTLASCKSKKLLHGGHYTFGYLADRYGLDYQALSGISSDSEPSAERMSALVRAIRSSGTKYLFAEELLSPRLTETLAQEAGVGVLMLHGAHNVSPDDQARGVSFVGLMERNLDQLRKGLACQEK